MVEALTHRGTRTVVCLIEAIRRRFASATEHPVDTRTFGPGEADFEILLSIDELAYLPPHAVDVVGTFEDVQRARLYVFLDLDAGNVIRSFRIAHAGFVKDVARVDRGYYVRVGDEPAAHFIPLKPEATAIVETVLLAQRAHQPVALRTASVCDPVIAARIVAALPEWVTGTVRIAPDLDAASLTRVSYQEAVDYFGVLTEFTCPLTSKESCIPTFWIVAGCQARAQRFCQILRRLKQPVVAAKKWAWKRDDDFMVVEPPNMPCCRLEFAVHVAVALRASDRNGYYVLDHALFTGPVTEDIWLSKLQDAKKQSEISSASVYLWDGAASTPRKEIENESEVALRYGRVAQRDMIQSYGNPPYQMCCITTHAAIRGCADRETGSGAAARTQCPPA